MMFSDILRSGSDSYGYLRSSLLASVSNLASQSGHYASVAALVCALAAAPACAQTSGAAFLEVDPSPRSFALGSADVISDPGAQAVGKNPSLLGLSMAPYEAFGAYQALIGNAQYEQLAFAAQPSLLRPYVDSLGFGLTRLSITGIPGADASGNLTGSSFSSGDTAVAFGASRTLDPTLHVGADVKAVQSQIASYSSNWALAVDLGLTWTLVTPYFDRPLTLAGCIDDLGQGERFISQTDPLPASLKLGAAVPVLNDSTVFVQMTDLIYDGEASASVGLEYTYQVLSVRAGFRYQINDPADLALQDEGSFGEKFLNGFTAGIGIHWGLLTFDYGFAQQVTDYGATQRVALSVAWGGAARTVEPVLPPGDNATPVHNP